MVDFCLPFPLTFAVWLLIIRLAAIQEFLFFLGNWGKLCKTQVLTSWNLMSS